MAAAMSMVTGMVNTMAMMISFPTDHCTFLKLSAEPTPRTELEMIWVEEMGAPARVDAAITIPDDTCKSNE